jgi:predicted dehydrogenase
MTTDSKSLPVREIPTALIGYGNAGRIFHAPLVSGTPGLTLAAVVSSKPGAVHADWPAVNVLATPEDAFQRIDIDLVVIATGNESHYPLARAALLAGKHVVVDKPCAVTLAQAEDLLYIAQQQARVLTVFQNRRWDADFLSLRQVLDSGVLGRIVHFESHFDRYRPLVPDRWREQNLPGSGLWFDLGAHLVDQCVQLFGAPEDIFLDVACQRDGAQVNDYFHAQLRYPTRHPGLRVLLHGSALVPAVGPRFVVHGTLGSWVKYGLDVQEDALKAGGRPVWGATQHWGVDPLAATLTIPGANGVIETQVATLQGNYLGYYAQLCAHLQGREMQPAVTPDQVWMDMHLLTLGEHSAVTGQWAACPTRTQA